MNLFGFAPFSRLVDYSTDATRTSSQCMRSLLRDTALVVTQLSANQTPTTYRLLRDRAEELVTQFAAALERHGYPRDVREDAVIAQCGLLDETALRHLSANDLSQWDAQPLQIVQTGRHDAGESVFERLEQRMIEASPNVDLLECYETILALGFVGRYASLSWNTPEGDGAAKRAALIEALNTRLQTLRPARDQTFVVERSGWRFTDSLYRLSPWAMTSIAGAVAVAIWFAWNATLDAQAAHLASQAVRP
ncbi:DotU family type IV/VI secretion system protein [Paraburkholderia sp. SARCC-3016]|uniref:DotU family type IV/VI secretion system protein n=1 Tax=Paraburkholderia sp. SARCC-3016 TaxID=3058611 RepID=UPI00280827FF|nr:DotU family type IV/VI secretion system protein [Paraburkholderia sp. SARCC-3016]MDQ7976148.1 DotU family type IV/VI secretion system protein [Paraburkholderia sp. SARCC-3016]